MLGTWISPTLYSINEKVRAELGPKVIKLQCNDQNLSNNVTAPHYKIGGRDATGRLIRPEEASQRVKNQAKVDRDRGVIPIEKNEVMVCVDWRAKHRPYVWKIYKLIEGRFVQVGEISEKDRAVARADEIYGEAF